MIHDRSELELGARLARRIAAGLASVLVAAAYAGVLPGDTIFLGLLSSDTALDVARIAGGVLLVWCLLRGNDVRLVHALAMVAYASVGVGVWSMIDPHAAGLLVQGTTVVESIVTIGFGWVSLVGRRLLVASGHVP